MALLLALQTPSIEQLLEQLDSDVVDTREDAGRALKFRGKDALPLLETAARGANLEVAARARRLMEVIHTRIAEESFRTIDETLSDAKTLQISLHFDWRRRFENDVKTLRGEGTLRYKKDRGVALTLRGVDDKRESKTNSLLIQGRTMIVDMESQWGNPSQCMKGLDWGRDEWETIAPSFVRGGVEAVQGTWVTLLTPLGNASPVSEYSETPGEEGVRLLRFRYVAPHEPTRSVVLSYRAEPLKLLKREIHLQSQKIDVFYRETYDDFSIDAELPDEAFKIPEVPK